MVDAISLQVVQQAVPDLTPDQLDRLHREVNAAVRRIAPCLGGVDLNSDGIVEAEGIVLRALDRRDVEAWVESVTTGKYSVTYRNSAGTTALFTGDDERALRKLCPAAAPAGMPEGSFPPPGGHDRLFRTLRPY